MDDFEFEVRKIRSPQGRKKLQNERAAYLALVAKGYSTSQACRIVGTNRKTGYRWRFGVTKTRTGRKANQPPARPGALPSVAERSRCLSRDERLHIADPHREGKTVRAIAAELGRSPSTISREIRRNRSYYAASKVHAYRPCAAQTRAESRRPAPSPPSSL